MARELHSNRTRCQCGQLLMYKKGNQTALFIPFLSHFSLSALLCFCSGRLVRAPNSTISDTGVLFLRSTLTVSSPQRTPFISSVLYFHILYHVLKKLLCRPLVSFLVFCRPWCPTSCGWTYPAMSGEHPPSPDSKGFFPDNQILVCEHCLSNCYNYRWCNRTNCS